jgi:translation initiation factor eIF-2B subunit epsilon
VLQANLGTGSKGYLWPPLSSREDGSNEVEHFDNLQHLRLGADDDTFDDSDAGSNSESEDEDGNSRARARRMSSASAASSTVGHGGADSEFRHECLQSLERAFTKNISVDNTAIELKTTIRMTYNMPLRRVAELAIGFLVDRIPSGDISQQRQEIQRLIGRWGPLIPAIGGTNGAETVGILQVSWKRRSDNGC